MDTINTLCRYNLAKKFTFEKIAVIGLGYVGYPLCVALAEKFERVVGFDIAPQRIATLQAGHDSTDEIAQDRIAASTARITAQAPDLADATFYIVTVPTPIDAINRPDLSPLHAACALIGPHLKKGDVVVFESTVYPGVTEDICGPLLEQHAGLRAGVDFNLGYSPERINPGDTENRLERITKNVSADTPATLDRVAAVYEKIITAGIYRAQSIKVAEGAKVLENTQRDINIALMNELAMICDRIDVNTADVIAAAATKWNFVPFTPGLVGGHCIGVDPYYLASLAEQVGYHPQVILSGRRMNDSMASYVANTAIKKLARRGGAIKQARVGVFGVTFKENVPDMRNSKSFEIIRELQDFGLGVKVHDPYATPQDMARYNLPLTPLEEMVDLDMMLFTVAHRTYLQEAGFLSRLVDDGVLMDVKSSFKKENLSANATYWSL